MGEPWLTATADRLAGSDAGVVTESGRHRWADLLAAARTVAAGLPWSPHGWVVPADGSPRCLVALLALGLADPAPSWVLGDPGAWSTRESTDTGLWRADRCCAAPSPPPGGPGPVYATATSGSTSAPRLLFGVPGALPAAVELYTTGMPEYAGAEVFATCSGPDFAAAFYMIVLPALVLARDLLLFSPHRWDGATGELAGRPAVCLAAPALVGRGARSAGRTGFRELSVVPAGGGLTIRRAERIDTALPGCRFLTMLGSTETGLLTVHREVREDGYVGQPLPGKPVWLTDVGTDGVGTLWTRGPDTRFAAGDGRLRLGPDGAVSTGDLAHADGAGGYFLDGRADDLVKVDGVSVYPHAVAAAVRALPGVRDALVSVDRTGPADRLAVVAVGAVTEGQVRAACAALPNPVVPQRVSVYEREDLAYSDRGKVVR